MFTDQEVEIESKIQALTEFMKVFQSSQVDWKTIQEQLKAFKKDK